MNAHRQAVAAALEALRIESSTGFSWCGEASPPLAAEVVEAMGPEAARAYLCHRLQGELYAGFYCSGGPAARQRRGTGAGPPNAGSPFVEALSRANGGSGSRESGWTVRAIEDGGSIVVSRRGLSLWTRPDEVIGAETTPGAEVGITLPPELRRLSPGFYMALGDEELDGGEPIIRHYWHLTSSGGEALVAAATRILNEEGLPFRLKVLADPGGYSRCDAGVLYMRWSHRAQVAAQLRRLLAEVSGFLRPGTPSLTKRLAAGLAVAENPTGPDSFGMHRCGLLADAAVAASERGLRTTAERLELVERRFEEEGISLDRPYLNAGSVDDYELAA